MTSSPPSSNTTILFAGGGTGGHIFPSLAIVERLRETNCPSKPHFLVSNRPLDAQILGKESLTYTPLVARPPSLQPIKLFAFGRAWFESVAQTTHVIQQMSAVALVAMGGFVAAPAVWAARKAGIPVVLVNLDAVPGMANKQMSRWATEVFSAYATPVLPRANLVGFPLRRSVIGPADVAVARRELSLDPERDTLLVTGASQGAESINNMMIELLNLAQPRKALRAWQVLHLSGPADVERLRKAYEQAQVPARVEAFCNAMGMAWRAADIAVSRAGAGSVAEAWANATPTLFFPYPYHKDQHQRLNTDPLVRIGAAKVFTDKIEPMPNARQLTGPLMALMSNTQQRLHMAELMRERQPGDGAMAIAQWLRRAVG
ncbi:MAG: UDP-N-acetylglucosamine--N-acetylmuramyl-(pentapeptide) pyrophosphoryl-undecaprenol N-acetylglucosamine transferase [Planctomycetota bacterium]|nr:UDP-N-acetylglucosamine--N-acetylmuramyl-(pentapeptide) pyrophosphoryl-undecaprenol N-acetylglucosamine transferase [Planctomycetota bacterium]